MREELGFRQRIGRIDTQERVGPRWPCASRTEHLYSPTNPKAVCQTSKVLGWQIEVALPFKLVPQLLAQCRAGSLSAPIACHAVVSPGEVRASRALWEVVPAAKPGPFYGLLTTRGCTAASEQTAP